MDVDQTLQYLLSTDNPFICLVHGEWGSGKTSHIQNLIAACRDRMTRPSYAYVSLFGLASIEAIEQAIFVNSAPSALPDTPPPGVTPAAARAAHLAERVAPLLPSAARFGPDDGADLRSLIVANAPRLLNHNMLIVIDDLDRHSPNVSASDICGFLLQLRDERACQIILVMNEEELIKEGGPDSYIANKEKLVDVELRFSRRLDAALAIGLGDAEEDRIAAECCRRLDIRNIRTIRKVRDYLARFRAGVRGSACQATPEFDARVQSTMVLAVWCHWQHTVNLADIKKLQPGDLLLLQLDAIEIPADERKRYELLSRYGYGYTDRTDRLVFAFVEQGFIDDDDLAATVGSFDEELARRRRMDAVEDAWRLYRGSLSCNGEAVAEALDNACAAAIEEVPIVALDAAVTILAELGLRQKADQLIAKFFSRQTPIALPGSSALAELVRDATLVAAWRRYAASRPDERTVAETVASLFGQSRDVRRDIEKLATFTADDFYDYFTTTQDPQLFTCIKGLYKLEWQAERNAIIEQRVQAALERIAQSGKINEIRLRNLLR